MSNKAKDDYENIKVRIDDVSKLIQEVATGNFDYKLEMSDHEDELEGLIGGINMLGEELKESTVSSNFMESIYQGVVDILIILKPDLTIDRVNEAAKKYLAYESSELIGQHILSLINKEDGEVFEKFSLRIKDKESFQVGELKLMKKNGDMLETSASFSSLHDNNNKHLGTIIIAKDITKIKKTERELIEEKLKAVKASKAKSEFLANMSHEIRTPLNGILGFLELLSSTSLDDTQKTYLNYVANSGRSLAQLLNDILDLAKVESGKLNLENISFNLTDAIKSCFLSHSSFAKQKGLELELHFSKTLPDFASGDPSRISQIITNLIGNALKFTESGFVALHVSCKSIDNTKMMLILEVIDSGIGVPYELKETIFQNFTQADHSTTRKYGGTGLGLTITKQLVEIMDGSIVVESPPKSKGYDKGTLFCVSLPLGKSHEKEIVLQMDMNETDIGFKEKMAVLLIDDNQINLMLAAKLLEKLNTEVISFSDAPSAIEETKKRSFDLVLMDLQMPEMDGYEATAALRSQGFKQPIIALSANVYQEDIAKCYAVGMNGHIGKPFTQLQMFNTIQSILESAD